MQRILPMWSTGLNLDDYIKYRKIIEQIDDIYFDFFFAGPTL